MLKHNILTCTMVDEKSESTSENASTFNSFLTQRFSLEVKLHYQTDWEKKVEYCVAIVSQICLHLNSDQQIQNLFIYTNLFTDHNFFFSLNLLFISSTLGLNTFQILTFGSHLLDTYIKAPEKRCFYYRYHF